MQFKVKAAVFLLPLLTATLAQAQHSGIYLKAGNQGLGIGASTQVTADTVFRLGIDGGSKPARLVNWRNNDDFDTTLFDVKRKPRQIELLSDWYPGSGSGWRLTSGVIYQHGESTLSGKTNAEGNISLNGSSYDPKFSGDITGKVRNYGWAPYAGIGWQSPLVIGSGLRFTADLGAYYSGKGNASLLAAKATGSDDYKPLLADLKTEVQRLNRQDKGFHPVAAIGLSYTF